MKPVQHLFCFYHTTEICSTPAFCGEFGCANNSHKKKKRDQVHHSKQKERCGCNSGCLKATDNLPDYNFCVMNHERKRTLQRSGTQIPLAHTLCANKPIPRHEPTMFGSCQWCAKHCGCHCNALNEGWFSKMEPIEGSL